jgi:hypothetical protein
VNCGPELRTRCNTLKKSVTDLELMSHFVGKLMSANAEVCFLAGAEFASYQASDRQQSAFKALTELFDKVKVAELDLSGAHRTHIGNVERAIKVLEDRKKAKEDAEKESVVEDKKEEEQIRLNFENTNNKE